MLGYICLAFLTVVFLAMIAGFGVAHFNAARANLSLNSNKRRDIPVIQIRRPLA